MDRIKSISLLALAICLPLGPVIAQDAYTTRIEPRSFYGAMVTIESGVRVFRPLPPTRHVIVNPGGATPLALSVNETRVYERSYQKSYNVHKHDHDYNDLPGLITHRNVTMQRY